MSRKRVKAKRRLTVNVDGYIVYEYQFSKKVKKLQLDYNQLRKEQNC